MIRLLTALLSIALVLPCFAGEEEVAKVFQQQMRVKPDSVSKTPMTGLYEVYAGGRFFYTNEQVTYLVQGNLFSVVGERNLTAEKKFKMLPLDLAIKQVKGNGKNTVVTFEDPNCSYCRKLGKDIAGMSDVTVYTFLVPILGADSDVKTRNILCAPNSGKAWTDWMVNGVAPPPADGSCDPAATISKARNLFAQQGARGTPFLMFPDGQVAAGYIPAAEMAKHLATLSK